MTAQAPMLFAPRPVRAKGGKADGPVHAALLEDPLTLCGRRAGEPPKAGTLASLTCDRCRVWVRYGQAVSLGAFERQLAYDRAHFRCCGAPREGQHRDACRYRRQL